MNVITDIEQVTPEWLTDVLHKAGVLQRGQVTAIEKDTSQPFGAIVSRLTVAYSEDTAAPRQFFLKVANPETHQKAPGRGLREVEFYCAIPQADYARLPLARCYHVGFDRSIGFHLLLDDLAETHISIPHPLPPSAQQCEQVVDTLARLHGYWWNDARLGDSMGRSAEQKTLYNGSEGDYPAFANYLGDRLWDEQRRIFERAIEAEPQLRERLRHGNLTLIHGDAHAWNFLYPRDTKGLACLVDWEAWDADIGVFDLAYMMTLFWFPAHRARAEKPLVERYYQCLKQHGVSSYSWDECWNDYRMSVIRMLFKPVAWWEMSQDSDFWPELWWPRLERALCAFEDLHCEELLS